MRGMITNVKLAGDKVSVTGEFDPLQKNINKAKVLFLIVQGDGDGDTVIIEGEAKWERDDPNAVVDWSEEVDNIGVFSDPELGSSGVREPKLERKEKPEENRVRGIALGIAIHPARPSKRLKDKFEPPQIEGLTWCVEIPLEFA